MFRKVLVANRGEIAVRIMRACRDLDVPCVAVYSEADATALHARYADEAYCIGGGPAVESYLNAVKIIQVARDCGAEAIHPGYGFLSEQAYFAEACEAAGIVFVGPSPATLRLLGDKVAARRLAAEAGVPTVPGTLERVSVEAALRLAPGIGYPLLIKAAAGGGGKGIRHVETADDLEAALRQAAVEAEASFGDGGLYLERYLDPVRHVEVQVLADAHGNVIHLGERECSVQRRSQKLIEESPSPIVDASLRRRLGEASVAIARQAGYNNAGTVEFLLDQSGAFYFIEANARLQVEHTVTEMVSGIDLVREQLRIAAGEPISVNQEGVQLRGWAIECRVLAEDAEQGFLPSLGRVAAVTEPSGPGVRVDSSLFAGLEVGQHYDSLLAKLVVWGQDRPEALRRLARALGEYKILGVKTTIPFHQLLLTNAEFQAGELDTHLVQRLLPPAADGLGGGNQALIVAALLQHERQTNGAKAAKSAWRQAARQDATHRAARGGPWRSTF